jgi:hypothetical protein
MSAIMDGQEDVVVWLTKRSALCAGQRLEHVLLEFAEAERLIAAISAMRDATAQHETQPERRDDDDEHAQAELPLHPRRGERGACVPDILDVEASHPSDSGVDGGVVVQTDGRASPISNAEHEFADTNRHLVEVPDRFAVARWSRDADDATIACCILGTLRYEPHACDTAVLRRALEGVIKHEARMKPSADLLPKPDEPRVISLPGPGATGG